MRKWSGWLGLALLPAALAHAQSTAPELRLPPPPPGAAALKPMRLARMETLVQVHGPVADTSVTMTFANPNSRALSGDLYFPLPEGATVSGYALDIEGRMVDGVVVGKAEGRQVFEKIVRQGLDPGLVEWTKGNHFKTRVFPLPAHGTRTIKVRYVADLLPDSDRFLYQLPLAYRDPLDQFQLRVEVIKPGAPPEVRSGGLANFSFANWHGSFVAETKLEHTALTNDLVIALPEAPQLDVAVEQSADGQTYFALHDLPQPPALEAAPEPKRVVILWDASGSRAQPDRRAREIALLQAWCVQHPGARLTLRVFRDAAAPDRDFASAEALGTALREIDYDGGTQPAAAARAEDSADRYLLFTDGLGTYGEEVWPAFGKPVDVFSADTVADHAALRALAERTGGAFFNLARLADDAVLGQLAHAPFQFLRATFKEGAVAAVYPASPRPVTGRFTLSGKLLTDEATVTVEYGAGGRALAQRTFTVSRKTAVAGELLRIGWAQRKLDDLLGDPAGNAAEIAALGRAHGLVTPGTTLIVLDRPEQYAEHRIRPPASLPDWQKRYDALLAEADKQKKVSKESKIERVLALWKERVAWWEKEFSYPKDFKYREAKPAKGGAHAGEDSAVFSMATDANAVPAPAAMAPRPAAGAEPLTEYMRRSLTANGLVSGLSEAAKSEPDEGGDAPAAIKIKAWNPKTPYLAALKKADKKERWSVYLQQKQEYGASPAFFLDCADYFIGAGDRARGLQVLSNVAELKLENAALLRVLGHRLAQLDELDLAARAFEAVRKLRPEEPQSHRDLALVLARRAEKALATGRIDEACRADFRRAAELLYQVVLEKWDRFEGIEVTALTELNRLLPLAEKAGVKDVGVDPRLVRKLDLDVRIVLTWDADSTDMDLWVTEPSGEKAMYNHPLTTIGGMVSKDFTDGYGPEEYLLRRAMKGSYQVEANFYGSRSADLQGAVTVQAEVFTHYGAPTEERRALTLRLTGAKDVVKVGDVRF